MTSLRRYLPRQGAAAWLCFLPVPCLFIALVRWVAPIELGSVNHSDPDYYYLLNSFLAATFEFPRFIDHPGIPLQILGGVVVRLKSVFAPESTLPLVDEFLRHAPAYYSFVRGFLLALNGVALFHVGVFYHRLGLPIVAAVLTQVLFFASPLPREWVGRIAPESLHVFVAAYAGIFLVRAMRGGSPLAFAFFCGSAMSLKLYFLPWALGFTSLGWRRALIGIATGSAVFFASFIFVAPVALPALSYVQSLLINSGAYGGGGPGVPDLTSNLPAFFRLLGKEPSAMLSAAFALYCAAVALLFPGRSPESSTWGRALPTWVLMLLVSFAAVIKQPIHINYLIPALGFVPHLFAHGWLSASARGKMLLSGLVAVILIATVALGASTVLGLVQFRKAVTSSSRGIAEDFLTHPGCRIVIGGGIPHAAHSLFIGNELAGRLFSDDLQRIYPAFAFFAREGPAGNVYRTYNSPEMTEEELRGRIREACVVYVTSGGITRSVGIPETFWSREGKLIRGGIMKTFLYVDPSAPPLGRK